MLDAVVRSGAIVFAMLLAIAVVHKVRSIGGGRAAAEPLIAAGSWTRRHATATLVGAGAVECCIAVALVVQPEVGYFAFTALLSAYVWRLQLLAANEDCNCFGEIFAARSRRAAVFRNAILAAGSLFAGALIAMGVAEPAAMSPTVVGLVAVAIAGGLALHVLNRLNQSQVLRNV